MLGQPSGEISRLKSRMGLFGFYEYRSRIMKTKGKYFWKQEWYSLCSMHRDGKDDCQMCQTGRWVNVWRHNVSSFIYDRWPKLWRWWKNLSWNKKIKIGKLN